MCESCSFVYAYVQNVLELRVVADVTIHNNLVTHDLLLLLNEPRVSLFPKVLAE